MTALRTLGLAAVSAVALLVATPARADTPAARPAPWFVDDDRMADKLTEKVGELARKKKCLPPDRLRKKVAKDFTCRLTPTKPSDVKLDPEDIYERALPSVFVVGSVVTNEDGDFDDGRMATAWVLAADGVLVTNWHVFEDIEDGEFFGVLDYRGRAYPLTDVLAVNKAADVAVIKVEATGLTPLPVAERPARVGSWVGVLGHPGDRYFTFTQGHVSRYTKQESDDGTRERWMSLTAEYAYGSSGSPVLDRRGAVVGMAALTESIDYPDDPPEAAKPKDDGKARTTRPARRRRADDPPKKEPPAEEKKPEAAKGSSLQMVVKLATPSADIRKAITADGEAK
jgi:serine protease Do